jgi:hypothetical protein
VSFEISAAKSEFYSGELIPLRLSFASTELRGFPADTRFKDHMGRLNYAEEFWSIPPRSPKTLCAGFPVKMEVRRAFPWPNPAFKQALLFREAF